MKRTLKRTQSALVLRPLKVPPADRVSLRNGLTVHVISRPQLPLLAVRLMVPAGSVWDPKDRLGIGDFSARLMRRGAAGKTADQISEEVDFVGAALAAFANEESFVASLATPSKHAAQMLEVMASIVRSPDFPDSEIELARRRQLAQLTNELDDPGTLADRALSRALWGQHPYGHEVFSGRKDLESFTRSDILAFHSSRIGPSGGHLYVVGDVTTKSIMPVIDRLFGDWAANTVVRDLIPDWSGPAESGSVVIVDKPEQTQVQVRIGARGVKRGHPDHFPLTVMNSVLGGSFTSRLMREIRVKRGLSYGAGCAYDMMSNAGTFGVSSFTKTERVQELIDVALAQVDLMRKKGPAAAEVTTVQRYISGLYPARLETNEAVAGAFADIQHYGLPADWIAKYRDRIADVSPKLAHEAAQKHLFDNERVLALVGNAKVLTDIAARYGTVRVIKPKDLE